ncbi:MAG: universal stress protein [Verrucomicrobiae bacterium]|nr:universal stress protein [Verrucomicrobiae bacterium]
MYRKLLIALENSRADEAVVEHAANLAKQMRSSILVVHVADGWAARNYERLKLVESDEMKEDRRYLEGIVERLRREGIEASSELGCGEPAEEILRLAKAAGCDLLVMGSHGHRFWADLILGSTVHEVRHRTNIPVLLVRGKRAGEPAEGAV